MNPNLESKRDKEKEDFGRFIKRKRVKLKLTLREFGKRSKLDFSKHSKIERGELQAYSDKSVLETIEKVLKIKKSSEEYDKFLFLAGISRGVWDFNLIKNEDLYEYLNIFKREFLEIYKSPGTRTITS